MRSATNVPLAPLTTLRLGGAAARFVEAGTTAELVESVATADARGEPVLVLGGGSNVVIADAGFAGLVVGVRARGVRPDIARDRVRVHVAAGEPLDELVAMAVAEGWRGIETLSGIPGLAGATPIQNVGAYGQEIADTLRAVLVYDRRVRAQRTLAAADCGFAYRDSIFRGGGGRFVVLELELELGRSGSSMPLRYAELTRRLGVDLGARAPLVAVRDAVLGLRRAKGMLVDTDDPESASVGSFFVNPTLAAGDFAELERRAHGCGALAPGERVPSFVAGGGRKVPAAWLVERAGFERGFTRSGVGVSRKHALALVHRGGGSARELVALAREIRDRVRERFGIGLRPEPVLVGLTL